MSDAAQPAAGTVLAFDFGEKRIGVAVGESALGMAHPLTTIETEVREQRFEAIGRLIAEWQPRALAVGLPLALDGSEHAMTARCRRFANQLKGRFNLPVTLVDERLSSTEADRLLSESSTGAGRRRGGKSAIDAVAAQIILQGYFDQGHVRQTL